MRNRDRWTDDRCEAAAADQAYERALSDAIRTANGEDFSDAQQEAYDRLARLIRARRRAS